MFIDDPTEPMLVNIRAFQQTTLAKLNALSNWSDEDFEMAWACYLVWYPEESGWLPTDQGLRELISNERIPASKLDKINKWLQKVQLGREILKGRDN